jgi:hypothetical protein
MKVKLHDWVLEKEGRKPFEINNRVVVTPTMVDVRIELARVGIHHGRDALANEDGEETIDLPKLERNGYLCEV